MTGFGAKPRQTQIAKEAPSQWVPPYTAQTPLRHREQATYPAPRATPTPLPTWDDSAISASVPSLTELDEGWSLDDSILPPAIELKDDSPGAHHTPWEEVQPANQPQPEHDSVYVAGASPNASTLSDRTSLNAAEGAFKLDKGQVKLAFKGDWDQMPQVLTAPLELLLQLHVVDKGPVVVFLIGITSPQGELEEVAHLVVDPFRRDVREMLEVLRTRFFVGVEFFDRRGRSRRSISFDKRLEVNADEILRVVDQFGVRTPGNGTAAVAIVNNPRFNRLGMGVVDGVFSAGDYTNLTGPLAVRDALKKLDFWLDSSNLDYLFFIKSQSAEEFREILTSVLDAAIGFGVAMSDPMKGLAIDLGFAPDLAELNHMQVASYIDVCRHLKPNDFNKRDEADNWDALFNDAAKADTMIDAEVLDLLHSLMGEDGSYIMGGNGSSFDQYTGDDTLADDWNFSDDLGGEGMSGGNGSGGSEGGGMGGSGGMGEKKWEDDHWGTPSHHIATSWEELSSRNFHAVGAGMGQGSDARTGGAAEVGAAGDVGTVGSIDAGADTGRWNETGFNTATGEARGRVAVSAAASGGANGVRLKTGTSPIMTGKQRPPLAEILEQIEARDKMWDTGKLLIDSGLSYLDELVAELRATENPTSAHVKVLALILAGLDEDDRSGIGWELRRDHNRKIREVARKANGLLLAQIGGDWGEDGEDGEELLARILASGNSEESAQKEESWNSEFDALFQGWSMHEDKDRR